MKREILEAMGESDLDIYAKSLGIELDEKATIHQKVDAIEQARNRTAVVSVLGFDVSVPIKRLHDKNVADKASHIDLLSDDECERLLVSIVGDEQFEAIVEHCTDDDGTVDVDAIGVFVARVLLDPELKNF